MAFTYDIESADATVLARSLIRRAIGDTVAGDGPLPGKANFSDAEIDALGEAGALRALSTAWAKKADEQAGPLRRSFSQISIRYSSLAGIAAAGGGGGRGASGGGAGGATTVEVVW